MAKPAGAEGTDDIVGRGLSLLPAPLAGDLPDRWAKFAGEHPALVGELSRAPGFAAALPSVWTCSQFVAEACLRDPTTLAQLAGDAERHWDPDQLAPLRSSLLAEVDDEAAAMEALRRCRQREMLRIAWRDLAGTAALDETLGHLSELADVLIGAAADWAHAQLAARFGEPRSQVGQEQRLMVVAMGKLGGRELNFSSDVDLVFLYPEGGETDGPKSLSCDEFFTRQGRLLIRLLDQVTAQGFVFRVDMRLRPFGDSGPLALSLTAFANYLHQHGRAWERYAYVKARPVTGHRQGVGLYSQVLRPFVFRRYLDYGLFDALREMKSRIAAEVSRRELKDNIKLGPGGIREIEFIVQCLQLLRGGMDPKLREPGLPAALARLAEAHLLPAEAAAELGEAWRFLRRLENRLQAWQDRQVHELPADEAGRARLALAMDAPDAAALRAELEAHRARVTTWFRRQTADGGEDEPADGLVAAWRGDSDDTEAAAAFAAAGYRDPPRALEAMRTLSDAAWLRRLDDTARRRLATTVPALARTAGALPTPEEAFERLLRVIGAIGGRSAYFALLNENPAARARFAELCGRSEFLASQVALHPLLLDDLIDPRLLDQPAGRDELAADLDARLQGVEPDDLESQMEALRNFQRAAVFRAAVADLTGRLPLMKVSDQLTWIAEVVLEASIRLADRHVTRRHGRPLCGPAEDALRPCGFAIIGYGKLGGLELGYGSDLDLVFVHDAEGAVQHTEGPDVVESAVAYARMTRRIVHLLATPTAAGVLYEVDTRLRPSGKGGLLVTSLAAFEAYQRDKAWTWEHQALLRARAVAGDPAVRRRFEVLRSAVLLEAVRRDTLREEVAAMRERMRRELSAGDSRLFDLKQDAGGVADIEFLVQYLVLANAPAQPGLLTWSDNVRQLESLRDAALLAPEDAAFLHESYLDYRRRLHHLALAGRPALVPVEEVSSLRDGVVALWQRMVGL